MPRCCTCSAWTVDVWRFLAASASRSITASRSATFWPDLSQPFVCLPEPGCSAAEVVCGMSQPEGTFGPIDWHALAERLGTLRADGESGGSELGRRALEVILGPEALRAAVDYYAAGLPGAELARSAL